MGLFGFGKKKRQSEEAAEAAAEENDKADEAISETAEAPAGGIQETILPEPSDEYDGRGDEHGPWDVDDENVPDYDEYRFSTLPVRAMAQAMVDAGVPAAVSYSAGTYVCNAVLFSVLDALAASQSTARAGFVHVPNSPEQACHLAKATPSMPVALMLQGIVSGLECACSWG